MVTGQLQDKAENLLQLYLLKNSNPEILHIALKKISCTHFLSQLIKDDEVKIENKGKGRHHNHLCQFSLCKL